jgi:hypothetical protein
MANPPSGITGLTITDGVRSGHGLIQVRYTLSVTQLVSNLQGIVTGSGLPAGLTAALNSTLDAALVDVSADQTAAACGSLGAFENEVEAQTGKKLSGAQAAALIEQAQNIQSTLGC